MMQAVWYESGEAFTPCATVRKTVFVAEQGYTLDEEFDEYDSFCPHLVLFDGEIPVATGRLVFLSDGTAKLGRIAVLKAYRGKHLGAKIVSALLERAKAEGAVRAYVSAQTYAVPFYNKFGFLAYGDEYLDGRIPHMDMEMPL
ncbi:MAG: GNAT family N-acetyltransferase [Candidatus Fimenecus sp.]